MSNGLSRFNQSLSRFVSEVYKYTGLGMFAASLTAFAVSLAPALMYASLVLNQSLLGYLLLLGFSYYLSANLRAFSLHEAKVYYVMFCSLYGFLLAPIFVIFTHSSIASIFGISGIVFLVASQYGMRTGQNLTSYTAVTHIVMLGVFIASVINFLIQSNAISFLISFAIAVGAPVMIAGRSQDLINIYRADPERAEQYAVIGALHLFAWFTNLFISLLNLLGTRRDNR